MRFLLAFLLGFLLLALGHAAFAAKPGDARARKAPEPDAAAALVGQRVAVETRASGLYLGLLTAVSRDALTLAIELPGRSISYTLPRGNVARITPR
jgi:hypothetical protein